MIFFIRIVLKYKSHIFLFVLKFAGSSEAKCFMFMTLKASPLELFDHVALLGFAACACILGCYNPGASRFATFTFSVG